MKIPPGTGNIGPDQEPVPGEDDHIDHADLAILSDLLDVYNVLDPMPEILPDVILFALEAHDVDAELARLVESELVGAGTRAVEHARSVTFSSDHLTVMVAVHPNPDGTVRLDGWAAPGATCGPRSAPGTPLWTRCATPTAASSSTRYPPVPPS